MAINVQAASGAKVAASGSFALPRAVALDGEGFLVVADSGNARLQRIRLDGGGAESVLLSGATGLSAIPGAGVVAASLPVHLIRSGAGEWQVLD